MKRAVASKSSQHERVRSAKNIKSQQAAKVLKLKVPKRRQIKARNLLLVCLLVALFAWSIYPLKQRSQRERENHRLQAEIDGLRAKNAKLSDEVERLKTPDYIEQMARQDLGLVKPGETSLLVVPAEESATSKEKPRQKAQKPDEHKNGTGPKKAQQRAESKAKKQDQEKTAQPQRSWWSRAFGFLDKLTGSKKGD